MAGYYFGCPHCRAKLETTDVSRAGRTVSCPQCQQSLIIPPPPKMGVALSQEGDLSPLPPSDDASQVVVSSDPGFKRPMSPAKAYSESDAIPAASSSGFDRLLPLESLDTSPSHVIEAGEDVEGYSFTLPENGAEEAPKLPKARKVRTPKPEEIDPPSPWEDPKRQLAVLVGAVILIIGITAWVRRSRDDKSKLPQKVVVPEGPSLAPPPAPVTTEPPTDVRLEPAPPVSTATPPGAPTNTLPGSSLPGAAPRPLPGSTPNVVPPPAE